MSFTIRPTSDDVDDAIAILEELGVFGAVQSDDGTVRLHNRKKKRIDEEGNEVVYYPEEQMTLDTRKQLERKGWSVVHSSAYGWSTQFPGTGGRKP